MDKKRRYLICYDIMDQRRLRKIHRILSHCAMTVQYSVFEVELTLEQLKQLKMTLQKYLDSSEDKLSIYRLFKKGPKVDLGKCNDDGNFIFI